jgi:hypothetical protein
MRLVSIVTGFEDSNVYYDAGEIGGLNSPVRRRLVRGGVDYLVDVLGRQISGRDTRCDGGSSH